MFNNWIKLVLIGGSMVINNNISAEIITLDKDVLGHLTTQCQTISLTKANQSEINHTISLLKNTLKPLLPAAGLAAPQIGIAQRIFIFSWDRTEAHQTVAINPSFVPIEEEKENGWEGCFSIILGNGPYQLANIPRYKTIKATYWDENGQQIHAVLTGFAARVFQHEFDHLEGLENIHRPDATIKTFDTREQLMAFMNDVKSKDKINYIQPTILPLF